MVVKYILVMQGIYTYTDVQMYTYIYTYIHMYIHISIYECIYKCICRCTYIYHAHIYICVYTPTHTYIEYTHAYESIYVRYIYVCVYTYIYTYNINSIIPSRLHCHRQATSMNQSCRRRFSSSTRRRFLFQGRLYDLLGLVVWALNSESL